VVDFTPDWTVAAYAVFLAAIAVMTFTIAPAVRTWRLAFTPWLKTGEQAIAPGRSRLSRALVVVQLTCSVLLLVCAGLAYRSLFLMGSTDPGFETRNLALVTINTEGSTTSAEVNAALLERVRERLRLVPGVQHASYARRPAFNLSESGWSGRRVRESGSVDDVRADVTHVGPEYLRVLGVSIKGQEFHDNERAGAVISQNLAETLWRRQSPIGRTLLVERSNGGQTSMVPVEVIGVSADGYFSGFRRERPRFVFLSAQQEPAPPGPSTFHIRYIGSFETVAPLIQRAMRDIDARTPIADMRTMGFEISGALWPIRVITTLLALFAGASLFIATIGQYAVAAFDMRRRVRELGVRIALGASSKQLLMSVMREGFALTIVGLTIGFALSLAVGKLLGQAFYGVTPTDFVTYLGVFALLSVASLLACYFPARHAARINPMTALRIE
jgi:predicted permease